MDTSIPSASSVQAAKEKRERLRKNDPEEDYISLSLTKRVDFSQGPHPTSRLVREEDELGEGDDGKPLDIVDRYQLINRVEFAEFTSAQERIALGKKSRKVEAKKRRDEMHEMIVDA